MSAVKVRFKEGVELLPFALSPEIMRGLAIAASTAPPIYGGIMVVTSQADGEHAGSKNHISLHYVGAAWDIRYKGSRDGGLQGKNPEHQESIARQWVEKMGRYLGTHWDILVEETHIHMEYDPK